ncbi:MAG TPA: glycosyltransferase family 4 protein [Thermoanaerobaculia bacterium]
MAKIGFCCTWQATDPNANSGYAFSIRNQLLGQYEVVDLLLEPVWPRVMFLGYKVAARLRGEHYGYEREPLYLDALARNIEQWARDASLDAIVCPTTIPVTRYRGPVPVVVVADQVFPSALGSYLQRVFARYRRQGLAQEREALAHCAAASFPTREAADAAVRDCGADPARVHVIPWGANLLAEPPRDEIERAVRGRARDACSLVFIGREWERKGGALVLATLDELRKRGVPAQLTIIGVTPPEPVPDGVRIIPFLDKQTPAGWQEFSAIMDAAHLLLVPSRAEAYGQVYCEAAAFGVPSVANSVGGVPSLVCDGRTGILVDPETATPADIAARIADLWSDRAAYEAMAFAAREDYERRLNWDRFGERFRAVVDGVIG